VGSNRIARPGRWPTPVLLNLDAPLPGRNSIGDFGLVLPFASQLVYWLQRLDALLTAAMISFGSAFQMKGFGVWLCSLIKRLDGRLEIDGGVEDAVFEPLAGEVGEEAFDGI